MSALGQENATSLAVMDLSCIIPKAAIKLHRFETSTLQAAHDADEASFRHMRTFRLWHHVKLCKRLPLVAEVLIEGRSMAGWGNAFYMRRKTVTSWHVTKQRQNVWIRYMVRWCGSPVPVSGLATWQHIKMHVLPSAVESQCGCHGTWPKFVWSMICVIGN